MIATPFSSFSTGPKKRVSLLGGSLISSEATADAKVREEVTGATGAVASRSRAEVSGLVPAEALSPRRVACNSRTLLVLPLRP